MTDSRRGCWLLYQLAGFFFFFLRAKVGDGKLPFSIRVGKARSVHFSAVVFFKWFYFRDRSLLCKWYFRWPPSAWKRWKRSHRSWSLPSSASPPNLGSEDLAWEALLLAVPAFHPCGLCRGREDLCFRPTVSQVDYFVLRVPSQGGDGGAVRMLSEDRLLMLPMSSFRWSWLGREPGTISFSEQRKSLCLWLCIVQTCFWRESK